LSAASGVSRRNRRALSVVDIVGLGKLLADPHCAIGLAGWLARRNTDKSPQCNMCGGEFGAATPSAWLRIASGNGELVIGALCGGCDGRIAEDPRDGGEPSAAAMRWPTSIGMPGRHHRNTQKLQDARRDLVLPAALAKRA
jgi:hypothetical protein